MSNDAQTNQSERVIVEDRSWCSSCRETVDTVLFTPEGSSTVYHECLECGSELFGHPGQRLPYEAYTHVDEDHDLVPNEFEEAHICDRFKRWRHKEKAYEIRMNRVKLHNPDDDTTEGWSITDRYGMMSRGGLLDETEFYENLDDALDRAEELRERYCARIAHQWETAGGERRYISPSELGE